MQPHRGSRCWIANDADLVTYALQDVVTGGTGDAAALSDPAVAGKTGTAQEYVDAWFCGYTPQLATCVWVGYPEGEIPMESVEGVSPGLRRHHPRRHLARLHDGRDAGAARRVVPGAFDDAGHSSGRDARRSGASPSPTPSRP